MEQKLERLQALIDIADGEWHPEPKGWEEASRRGIYRTWTIKARPEGGEFKATLSEFGLAIKHLLEIKKEADRGLR